MVNQLADLFPMILLAATGSLLAGPLMIKVAPRLGLVDQPGSAPHKRHPDPTPLVGGPVLAIALLLAVALTRGLLTPTVSAILIGAIGITVWGVLDDFIDLAPGAKLVGQVMVAGALIALGVQVRILRIPALDILLTLTWYVGMINAFNFVDSMDGLALGLASIASAFFMLVTIDSGQPALALLAAGILGGCIGLFLYNTAPARLFLGDSGAELLGYLLAAIGVAYVPAGAGLPQGVSWFTPILVLGVPIFDMTLVVVSRLRRREPLHIGSRDHTYHRLVAYGIDATRSVVLMQLVAVMLGLVAFLALDASVAVANIIFGGIVLTGCAGMYWLDQHPVGEATGER